MTEPAPQAPSPADRHERRPEPAAAWMRDHPAPATEGERETLETVWSVSRLEESN